MIPTGGQTGRLAVAAVAGRMPSRTWRLDPATGRIGGKIDGLEAVRQAVWKILQTERYQYMAYSFNYGVELRRLTGQSPALVRSELRRRIEEALLQDNRVEAVEDMEFVQTGDAVTVRFTVRSAAGRFTEEVKALV